MISNLIINKVLYEEYGIVFIFTLKSQKKTNNKKNLV